MRIEGGKDSRVCIPEIGEYIKKVAWEPIGYLWASDMARCYSWFCILRRVLWYAI